MNIATTSITSAMIRVLGATPAQSDNKGLKVSPAHLNFGKVQAGQTSAARTVTPSIARM